MNQAIAKFIGTDCAVTTMKGETLVGVVESVEENWMTLVPQDNKSEVVNLDFVTRVRPVPLTKKGKRKVIF